MGGPRAVAIGLTLALVAVGPARADDDPSHPDPGSPRIGGWTDTDAARSPAEVLETPLSLSVVERDEFHSARPAAGLEEALDLVPGVFAQTSGNYAQDTRLSIRGSGARAPFGVRGVRVLVDGIPTTGPDGQSELDSIDLEFVERVEVVRGPISSLYGGGANGLVSISTIDPTPEPHVSARALWGSDHLSRYGATATGTLGSWGYALGSGYTRYSGYRDHARAEQTSFMGKLTRELADGSGLELHFSGVSAPEAQDPGGLNLGEVRADREQARPQATVFDTGEKLSQQKVAIKIEKPLAPGRQLDLVGYYLQRDFSNKLPFASEGRVKFDREVAGGSAVYRDRWQRFSWLAGTDADIQNDLRKNYDNLMGAEGPLVTDQRELVRSLGPFGQLEIDLGALVPGLSLIGGGRYDWLEYVAHVRTPGNAPSDRIHYRQFSPRVGVHYGHSRAFQTYFNYSTSFRPPTTTELAVDDPAGGFDTQLEPEKTVGLELGAKGLIAERVAYEAAVYSMRIRDALVPFQDFTTMGTRDFFRNAGEVHRRGVEVGLSALLHPWLPFRGAYNYGSVDYHDYDPVQVIGGVPVQLNFDGNREPNMPRSFGSAELRFAHPTGWFAVVGMRFFSDLYTNDANTAKSAGATTASFRMGRIIRRDQLELRPFMGLTNWTGVRYNGTVRPNAVFGRYYDPAPETQVYGGLEIRR